jgi:hypothetical protein
MDSGRWVRIQSLFHDAVDLPADEREPFLESDRDRHLERQRLHGTQRPHTGRAVLSRGDRDSNQPDRAKPFEEALKSP